MAARFHARAVVGFQVAEHVLHAEEDVLEDRRDRVDLFVVAVRFVEDAAFAFATDPTERVVAVRTRILLLGLVLVAHLRVVHARQDAHVLA